MLHSEDHNPEKMQTDVSVFSPRVATQLMVVESAIDFMRQRESCWDDSSV